MNCTNDTAEIKTLAAIIEWVEFETGLCFPEVHHDTIRKTVQERCEALCMEITLYLNQVKTDDAERTLFFNAITIGETYFFRDERQFSLLVSTILPVLLLEKEEVRVWSATCASGEEVISLIAVLNHVNTSLNTGATFRLLASDINAASLESLKSGIFPLSSFRNDGKKWHPLLSACGTMHKDSWHASEESLSYIHIQHLNILSGEKPSEESQDIVFFRNTLVYMKNEHKEKAVSRIITSLRPGGFLFVASPEVPTIQHPELEVMEKDGVFFFKKVYPKAEQSEEEPHAKSYLMQSSKTSSSRDSTQKRLTQKEKNTAAINRELRKAAPKKISTVEIQKGLALASLWTLNPQLKKDALADSTDVQTAAMIEGIMIAIQSNQFTVADELLHRFEELAKENFLSLYLRGLSLKHQGDNAAALELWEHARLFNPKFWPALFQAGLSYEKTNPERSRLLLKECVLAIQSDLTGNQNIILLEGFDASYFQRMAEKLLLRINNT